MHLAASRCRARVKRQRRKLLDEARAVEEAGAFAVVLECVPKALAKKITESISIPTIGIGAGADCDGQVLVYQDMLAMYANMKPKFVKQFAQVGKEMNEAFTAYKKAVEEGSFLVRSIPLRWMRQ